MCKAGAGEVVDNGKPAGGVCGQQQRPVRSGGGARLLPWVVARVVECTMPLSCLRWEASFC